MTEVLESALTETINERLTRKDATARRRSAVKTERILKNLLNMTGLQRKIFRNFVSDNFDEGFSIALTYRVIHARAASPLVAAWACARGARHQFPATKRCTKRL